MRCSTLALAFVPLIVMSQATGGCASHEGAKPGASSLAQTGDAGQQKAYTMQHEGRDVLRLTAPADAPCELSGGAFEMKSRDGYVNIWLVRGARTVDEGVGRVGGQITSEFKDFKATSTTTITLAPGESATRMLGTGFEADDNDPGKADVIVFKKGGRVFVACTHGESMRSSAQQLMATLVQTATAP